MSKTDQLLLLGSPPFIRQWEPAMSKRFLEIPYNNPMKLVLSLFPSPFYREKNWVPERLDHLPRVILQVNINTSHSNFRSCSLSHLTFLNKFALNPCWVSEWKSSTNRAVCCKVFPLSALPRSGCIQMFFIWIWSQELQESGHPEGKIWMTWNF